MPIVKIHGRAIQVARIRDRFLDSAAQAVEFRLLDGDVCVVQRGFDQPVPRIVGVFVRTIVGEVAVIVVGWGNRRTAEGAGDHQVVPGIVDVVVGIAVITHLQSRELGFFTGEDDTDVNGNRELTSCDPAPIRVPIPTRSNSGKHSNSRQRLK
jgi:hypothetical protein